NRLAELIDGVRSIRVIADDQRELLTLMLTDRANTEHPARSLSDGALRFLALAVLEHAPEAGGLLCLEEPENGIHPRRIPAMLRLLKDLVVDTGEPVGPDNPLRQLIVNTHSPAVVSQVDGEDLLIAVPVPVQAAHRRSTQPAFRWLDGTWRAAGDANEEPIPLGTVLSYLHPQEPAEDVDEYDGERQPRPTRVMDRGDVRTWLSSSDSSRPS
ncbi:MAG: ATP-binding protein, partial [bacterium]|nr:ATP-binding protein [bacterium]